jgi:hypothetical protein
LDIDAQGSGNMAGLVSFSCDSGIITIRRYAVMICFPPRWRDCSFLCFHFVVWRYLNAFPDDETVEKNITLDALS